MQREHNFLLVLMWPTWPQLAHLRCVAPAFLRELVDVSPSPAGEAASLGEEASVMPLALLRASRRSLLRSRRASSPARLW